MSKTIYEKGNFLPITNEFRQLGLKSLHELHKFQVQFGDLCGEDTDTTINSIRDALVANILDYDLLNIEKHGFDAKCSKRNLFLEIKQCSLTSKRLGGTWNDTNEEKARAFMSEHVYTAVAVWHGASDLQFIVYGQHQDLGQYLLDKMQNRKNGSRSTQSIAINKLLDWGFKIKVPRDKERNFVIQQIEAYSRKLAQKITQDTFE